MSLGVSKPINMSRPTKVMIDMKMEKSLISFLSYGSGSVNKHTSRHRDMYTGYRDRETRRKDIYTGYRDRDTRQRDRDTPDKYTVTDWRIGFFEIRGRRVHEDGQKKKYQERVKRRN